MKATFQGFWHGPALGPIQRACLETFLQCGHKFDLFTYENIDVPQGIQVHDASEIVPFEQIFYFENPNTGKRDIGPFSDLFRFKLLYERGGWWSDVDTVCIAKNIFSSGQAWAREAPRHSPSAVGTSQLLLEKGGTVAKTLYERCLQISRSGFRRREDLGPRLISRVIDEMGLPKDLSASSESFFPVSWIETFKLWLPEYTDEIADQTQDTIFIPIYQSFPQFIGLDVSWLPPKGSFLGNLCERLPPSDSPQYEAIEVRSALKAFLTSHDWARDELGAYCGSAAVNDLMA